MKNILIVVDYQYDFVSTKGNLPVVDAKEIKNNIQELIDSNKYEDQIFTFDTHTSIDYLESEEAIIFPNIHCEYNTKGWWLYKIETTFGKIAKKIFADRVKIPKILSFSNSEKNEFYFTKDKFDIWEGNSIYPNWFTTKYNPTKVEIDVCGVATNYCVFMHVIGLIQRGYKVNVINSAVKGIKSFPDGEKDESFDENIQKMIDVGVMFK